MGRENATTLILGIVFLLPMVLIDRTQAAVITAASVSGPTFIATGIGQGNGQQAAAMGFHTNNTLLGVSISAPISTIAFDGVVDAYLTHKFGPGTTQSDVLQHVTVNVPVNSSNPNNPQFTPVTFFSGLTLSPGDYDLVLAQYGPNTTGVGFVLQGSQTFTFAPGVSFLGTFGTAQQGGTFAPGFGGWGNEEQNTLFAGDIAFTVTATAVPEPASAALCLLAGGLLLAASSSRTRRRVTP